MVSLADYIRLGSLLKPQGIGSEMGGETSCAFAAACEAAGIPSVPLTVGGRETGRHTIDYATLHTRWPFLDLYVPHPECPGERFPLYQVIFTLNDTLHWTREQIADWLEPIERAFIARELECASPATTAVAR